MRPLFKHLRSLALLPACLVVLCAVSCNDNDDEEEEELLSSEKAILSFYFHPSHNSSLTEEVEGVITGTKIEVNLPDDTELTGLRASFIVADHVIVTVAGVIQDPERGELLNFSNPVIYIVTAEDKTTIAYTVNVHSRKRSSEKAILTYSLLKQNNPSLTSDVFGVIQDFIIHVEIPVGASSFLIPTFSISDKATISSYDGPQVSGQSEKLFLWDDDPEPVIIEYDLVAENQTTFKYYVKPMLIEGDLVPPVSPGGNCEVSMIAFSNGRDEGLSYFFFPTTATIEYNETGQMTRVVYFSFIEDNYRKWVYFSHQDYQYENNKIIITSRSSPNVVEEIGEITIGTNGYPSKLEYLAGPEYDEVYTYDELGYLVELNATGEENKSIHANNDFKTQKIYHYDENHNVIREEITENDGTNETSYELHGTHYTDMANYEFGAGIGLRLRSLYGSALLGTQGKAPANLQNTVSTSSGIFEYSYLFDDLGRVVSEIMQYSSDIGTYLHTIDFTYGCE